LGYGEFDATIDIVTLEIIESQPTPGFEARASTGDDASRGIVGGLALLP
jgi:hypothetical protein